MLRLHYRGAKKPFDHQQRTVEALVSNPRFFIFNDIGTGKTACICWALDNLFTYALIRHAMIVAPLSTIHSVWDREWRSVNDSVPPTILRSPSREKRRAALRTALNSERSLTIINHDALYTIAECDEMKNLDIIVLDESALYRHPRTRRARTLFHIYRQHKVRGLWCLTGDPTPEAPTDIWATARLICPDKIPTYYTHFREQTMYKIDRWRYATRDDAQDKIARALSGHFIRYTREECLDMPPVIDREIEIELSAEQKQALRELRAHASAVIANSQINAINEADIINKMLQVSAGTVYRTDERGERVAVRVGAPARIEAFLDIISSSSQPVICYAPFTAAHTYIAEELQAHGVDFVSVDGSTSDADRTRAFDAIQSAQTKVLLAHPRAMAHGVTLTRSNVIAWWVPIYSSEIYTQAIGRITRHGQNRSCYIIHLIGSDIERRVLRRLNEKRALAGTLLEYLESNSL